MVYTLANDQESKSVENEPNKVPYGILSFEVILLVLKDTWLDA